MKIKINEKGATIDFSPLHDILPSLSTRNTLTAIYEALEWILKSTHRRFFIRQLKS